jgi:predicted deacylase
MALYDASGAVLNTGSASSVTTAPYYIPNESGALNPTDKVYHAWTVEELYSAWDALMESYPDYISCTIADYTDASGAYDLRRYVLLPESGVYEKTIYIQAGAHGNEIAGQMSILRIAQIICEDWQKNEKVAYLRNKVRIVINPLVNPWGKPNLSVGNVDGININRNYDGYWQKVGGGTGYNSGDYPFQTNENKWVKETIDWIGAENIHYAFDFHDAGTMSLHGHYWVDFNAFHDGSRSNVMQMIHYLCDKNVDGDPNIWHCKDTCTYATFSQWMNKTMGVPASTVEHCYETKHLDADFMNRAVEVYFNTVLVHTLADYKRPLDISSNGLFKLDWCSAVGEKEFKIAGDNTFNNISGVIDLFEGLVDGEYITKSETSITDSAGKSLYYYSLTPPVYSKTLVLYGGLATVRTNNRMFNGVIYKLAKLLRDNAHLSRELQEIRDNWRIVVIPYLDTVNPDVSGNYYLDASGNFTTAGDSSDKACVANLKTFLNAIGNVALFIYCRDRMTADVTEADSENWVIPAAQENKPVNLADTLTRTGNVKYEIVNTTGSVGDYLNTQGIDSIRIDSTIDFVEWERVKLDFPSADDTPELDKTDFATLNSETARRLSVLVNLIRFF